jgi:hypothetical protein
MANELLHEKKHFEVELDSHCCCRRHPNLNLVIFEELLSTPPALPNGLRELPSKNEFRGQNLREHDVVENWLNSQRVISNRSGLRLVM